jgi:glyoxylase-like metal-dependent hydrolase (beta-lactamase superfamily II)
MKTFATLSAAIALVLAAGASAQPSAPVAPGKVSITRLDCGVIKVSDFGVFTDTFLYEGKPKTLTASCYLIRNGSRALLWDTGVAGSLAGKPAETEWVFTISLKERVVDQLAKLGLKPADVNFVGISHYHDDHTGQAADFPGATLLIGLGDWDVVKTRPETAKRFTPWISGGAKVEPVARDKDVFGDKSVVILDMPGHTPGHKALLVRLKSGPVLLTGDLYHATEQVPNRGVPSFNTNRADTLASFDRFQAIAKSLNAKVIIQHEPADIAKLPAFPAAAE